MSSPDGLLTAINVAGRKRSFGRRGAANRASGRLDSILGEAVLTLDRVYS